MTTYVQLSGPLFEAVQLGRVFSDSKTFVDARPTAEPGAVAAAYERVRDDPGFDLLAFVKEHFVLPDPVSTTPLVSAPDLGSHVLATWKALTRPADRPRPWSTLVALPEPYVVPGGRFREIYYWDTYFSALGLVRAGLSDLARGMLENLLTLQSKLGLIPNGNRAYYTTRSQPPVLFLLVDLVLGVREGVGRWDPVAADRYLGALEAEHSFWTSGHRSVTVGPYSLSRYWDDDPSPRPESYYEDVLLGGETSDPARLYRNLRAGAESGWDFSSRWLGRADELASIRTTEVLPVDLNSLLFGLERSAAALAARLGRAHSARRWAGLAGARRRAIRDVFWAERSGFFMDVDLVTGSHTDVVSAAAAVPLFVGAANTRQALRVRDKIRADLVAPGGVVSTTTRSTEQWDSPNGWAPLQWFVAEGFRRYGFAYADVAARFVETVRRGFAETGTVLEKYDVVTGAAPGGGEYEVQVGFGWTNGVVSAFEGYVCEE